MKHPQTHLAPQAVHAAPERSSSAPVQASQVVGKGARAFLLGNVSNSGGREGDNEEKFQIFSYQWACGFLLVLQPVFY